MLLTSQSYRLSHHRIWQDWFSWDPSLSSCFCQRPFSKEKTLFMSSISWELHKPSLKKTRYSTAHTETQQGHGWVMGWAPEGLSGSYSTEQHCLAQAASNPIFFLPSSHPLLLSRSHNQCLRDQTHNVLRESWNHQVSQVRRDSQGSLSPTLLHTVPLKPKPCIWEPCPNTSWTHTSVVQLQNWLWIQQWTRPPCLDSCVIRARAVVQLQKRFCIQQGPQPPRLGE